MRYVFLLILLLPLVAQVYVAWRTWQLVPFPVWGKVAVVVAMAVCFALFFVAMMPLLDRLPMSVASCVYEVGTSWLIILFYLLMLWLAFDVLRLCHIVPAHWLRDSWTATAAVVAILAGTFGYGYAHYLHKVRQPLELTTAKRLERPVRIVMTSDWHLGYHNRRAELRRWVDLINAERPDLVLVAGDLIDRSVRPLEEEEMAVELRRLTAPVYACLGNHEYFAGEPSSAHFFRKAGIHLLRDSVAVAAPVVIVGRDDRTNPARMPLAKLMDGVPTDRYVILLDHQPYHLDEAEAAGVDFELAGHTHHGQVWPANKITDALYECAFGTHRRGATRYYVSSGLGIWGGKFRIGTRSEYVVATLRHE